MRQIRRREMLNSSIRAVGATLGLPLLGLGQEEKVGTGSKLRILIAGAHPDDPESGCGGTAARYTDLSHEVFILYLTRGEAGIDGKSNKEAAEIRSAESSRACEILKARPLFVGQVDAETELNPTRYQEFQRILEAQKPDLVFTHWPIDTHRDHRTISMLVFDAWLRLDKSFALYYFEVMSGKQSQHFHPTNYVDITSTEHRKRASCFAHVSQKPTEWYPDHDMMNRFRGMESGCKYAEAFVRHLQSRDTPLPK